MAEIYLPFFAQAAGITITIEGVIYRVARVDPGGRLLIADEVDSDDIRVANKNYTAAATNDELIAAPGAGKAIYVVDVIFSTAVDGNFKLVSKTSSPTDEFGPHYFPANGGMAPGRLGAPMKFPDNENLGFTSSIAGAHTITVIAKVQ